MIHQRAGWLTSRSLVSWSALAVFCCLGLATAASAGGEGAQPLPPVSAAPRSVADPSEVACEDAGTVAGTVSSVSGAVFAQAPGEDPRSLACDDVVRACDRIFTSDGATVALMIDDVYVQLGQGAVMTVESPRADFFVHAGGVRVIDTRASDAPHFGLATPQLRSRGLGSDTEVHVGIALAQERSRLCSFGSAVNVSTAAGVRSVADGACIEVIGTAISAAANGTPSIALEAALECRRDFAGLANRFLPTDVAAPPLLALNNPPVGPPNGVPPRIACDVAAGCLGPPPPPVNGAIFRDPNPNLGGGFPGAPPVP